MKKLDKTVALNSGEQMKMIAKPLFKYFNINCFGYAKTYNDGTHIDLCTAPEWLSCFYSNFYNHSMSHREYTAYKNSYTSYSQLADQVTVKSMSDDFGLAHGFSIIKKHDHFSEFFGFTTTPDNPNIQNWYYNNIDILENFILYFKEQASDLILTAENDRLILPNNVPGSISDIYLMSQNEEINNQFLNEIKQSKKPKMHLTDKEFAVMQYIIRGYSMKQTAALLNASPRTIESHLCNLKRKTNSKNVTEMAMKIIKEIL